MEIRLLGPFEVHDGAENVDLGDLQQRYLLAVLVLHANRAVAAERLIEIVWAGQVKPKTNLVPGYVVKLRRLFRERFGDELVIDRVPTGYVLRVDPGRIDSVRFAALAGESARCTDPARRLSLLREAVGLWRGRYLEDLDHDRVGAAELVSPEEARFDALGDLAELELLQENHRRVRDQLRPVVRLEPTRHRLAGLLMRALIANGDRVPAMEVYHSTRAALDQYGLEIPVELRKLARFAQLAEPRLVLPRPPARFGGRRDELAAVESRVLAAVAGHRPGTVWISGLPGVGKTALAVQAAHQLRAKLPDGQIFVSLNGFTPQVRPTGLSDALGVLLGALGVPPERHPPTVSQRIALYQSTLSGTSTLVVLDNALSEEHVRSLLPASPGCAAIVTSRRAGGVEVEDEIRLGPLTPAAAVALFSELAGADRVRGRRAQVEAVVARCGRVPLPIKVVAAQFRAHAAWSLEHLLGLLDQENPWHTTTSFEGAAAAACAVSYRELPGPQQDLFRLFGELPGADLSVPAAAAVAGCTVPQVRELLDGLHSACLVEEVEAERYLMLDPLREYAGSLPPPAGAGAAITGLLDFYLVTTAHAVDAAFPLERERLPGVARSSPVALAFADARAARAWLSAERSNLLEAIRYAAAHDRPEHAWQPAVLLWRWYYVSGYLQEWLESMELARKVLEVPGRDRHGLAGVLLRLSGAHRQLGRPGPALEAAAQALSLWTALDDPAGEASALCAIALVTMDRGESRSAVAHFEAALEKFEALGDERGQANALGNLGQLDELLGHFDLAESRLLAAVGLLRRLGHTQGLAHALDNLGVVRQRLGRLEEALADHTRAGELAASAGDRGCEAYALNNIGAVHRLAGRLDEAIGFHERARQLADLVGEPALRTQLYLDRGATYQARREADRAREAYLAAVDLAAGTGDRGRQAHAHHGVARVLHGTGDHTGATRHWRAARAGFGELGWLEEAALREELAALDCPCAEDR
ncbi:MAG TPA: tetratricopeptide repeat protein [Amycolatopsis sp.]